LGIRTRPKECWDSRDYGSGAKEQGILRSLTEKSILDIGKGMG